jgi:hypothetical protein
MESGNDCDTMAGSMKTFHELLAKFDIPLDKAQDVNINEYAVYGEQVPSAGAWWIAGLERENAHGLRGNWAIAGALHDFLAGKVSPLMFVCITITDIVSRSIMQTKHVRWRIPD